MNLNGRPGAHELGWKTTCLFRKSKTEGKGVPVTVTLPASPNHELGFDLGWMKWVIFSDREGLMRDTVHAEGHTGNFPLRT